MYVHKYVCKYVRKSVGVENDDVATPCFLVANVCAEALGMGYFFDVSLNMTLAHPAILHFILP